MFSVSKLVASMAVVFTLLTINTVGADDVKPLDGGKGSAFKSKSFDMREKGEVAVVLSFEAGKEVILTTSADKETDVQLMVKGMYFEAKDTSPGPVCLIKFTPVQGDEKFTIGLKSNGSGGNKVTLKVKVDD